MGIKNKTKDVQTGIRKINESDIVNQQYEIPYIPKKINKKNDPLPHEYFYEKINLSSTVNKMYSVDELIDAPEVVNPSEFSKLGDMNSANVRKENKTRNPNGDDFWSR